MKFDPTDYEHVINLKYDALYIKSPFMLFIEKLTVSHFRFQFFFFRFYD